MDGAASGGGSSFGEVVGKAKVILCPAAPTLKAALKSMCRRPGGSGFDGWDGCEFVLPRPEPAEGGHEVALERLGLWSPHDYHLEG